MSSPEQEAITVGETDGGPFALPVVEVLTGRGFITGKSGAGKSNTASVVVEELLDDGFAVMIVDIEGEYWGLKEDYEILHVGADDEADLVVGPEHAEKLATLALEQNVPIILDVSGFLDAVDRDAMVEAVARELFAKEKTRKQPFALFVEEIHEYIPQSGGLTDCGKMLTKVAKRGRKHGLGLCGLSQRPADVKKDVITQCDWLVWHRLTWNNDTRVVRDVIGGEYADRVQDLGDGEAFVMADWEADIRRVRFRRKRTFDAGATPDLDDFERPDLKSVSGDLVDELEEISQRENRRQDRIADLEAEVERLQAEKAALEEDLEDARDMSDMARQFADAMTQAGGDSGAASAKVDELVEQRNALQRQLADRDERIDDLEDRVADLREYEERVEQQEALDVDAAAEAVARLREALGMDPDGEAEKWRRKYQQERAELRERVDELEAENERLRAGAGGVSTAATDDELTALLHHEAVQAAIDTAKANSEAAADNFDPVLSVLATADGEPLSAQQIAAPLSVSATTVRRVAKALHSAGVVQTTGGNPTRYKLDREFIEQRIEVAEKQAALAADRGGGPEP